MSERRRQLANRRQQLQLRSAAQRRYLGTLVTSIDARLGGIDRGMTQARLFLRRPVVLAGVAVGGLVIGPRRILRLAGQAVLALAAARRLLRIVRR